MAARNWSVDETNVLLDILKDLKIINRLDGRKQRNDDLFRDVFEKLNQAGVNRSLEQIKNRWKALKSGFYKAKNDSGRSGAAPTAFVFYQRVNEILGGRPLANTEDNGMDVGFEDIEDVAGKFCCLAL